MRKLALISLLALTACAGARSNQVYSQINAAGQKEGDAWQKVWELSQGCPHGTEENPMPPAESLKRQDCVEALIQTHVLPVALYPVEIMDYMAQDRALAISYKEGKISRDRANLKLKENWNAYFKAITTKADQTYQQAYQQDKALGEQQQQYFQNLSQQLNQAELARQESQQANKPTTTNCHTVAGTLQCTTW